VDYMDSGSSGSEGCSCKDSFSGRKGSCLLAEKMLRTSYVPASDSL
jgi:hypothetical protein